MDLLEGCKLAINLKKDSDFTVCRHYFSLNFFDVVFFRKLLVQDSCQYDD